jgi:hypothetical protein
MSEYQEIQTAIKVIEKHFKDYKRQVDDSMNVNSNIEWGAPLDNGAIVDSIKGLSVLIAFENVIKELKAIAYSMEDVKDN